jgi:glutathione synthase
MHVLFIIDPLLRLKAYKDSSVAMMRALGARDHTFSVALQDDIYIEAGRVLARATPIVLVPKGDLHRHDWWQENGQSVEQSLAEFDAVLVRKDPPYDMEYVYLTHMLDYAQSQGAKVYNQGSAIRNHSEKLAITEFAEFTAPTLVTRDIKRLKAFHTQQHDIIVKPLDGMGGLGVFRLRAEEPNLNVILETLTHQGHQTIMAQRYIPEVTQDGDKRILLIAGEPVPYVLARHPSAGETRANLAAGGLGVAQPLSAYDRQLAELVASRLAPRGLFLVGLDVIARYITEINVTSPTCFVEISEQTGFDVPDMFVQALERVVAL